MTSKLTWGMKNINVNMVKARMVNSMWKMYWAVDVIRGMWV
jgi:hypothetical protein